ncbi:sce7725 family protein [bacterium]|nr:sce7725 family protein [bacterium]
MYYPYYRGKQFELSSIRECAEIMATCGFVPIIEPVRESTRALERTLRAVADFGGQAIVILNPVHGERMDDQESTLRLLRSIDTRSGGLVVCGFLLTGDTALDHIEELVRSARDLPIAFIHYGFGSPMELSGLINRIAPGSIQIFEDQHCGMLYRRHFRDKEIRVLLHDGFVRRQRNSDYPPRDFFSELHLTYPDQGATGFGDFLIVGDEYSDGGGPAYAVTIHISYIDRTQEDQMYVSHFMSHRRDDPTDPAGKFAEALHELMSELDRPNCQIYDTEAMREFRDLHTRGHFPGLGYVKKLSMNHHVQTLAGFFRGGTTR